MKRIWLVLFGAFAALTVIVITNFPKLASRFTKAYARTAYVAEDESGNAVAALNKPVDLGQRREIAEMMTQISKVDGSQWTKSFELASSEGRTLHSDELKGQLYVANFFFSTCPSTCKQQTDQVKLLQSKYKDAPVRFVSISVDPEVDTPEKLAAYATAADAIPGKWFFLTGDMKSISKVGSEMFLLGVMRPKMHPDRLCLVDANGVLVGKYNWHEAEEVQALKSHIDELIATMKDSGQATPEGT